MIFSISSARSAHRLEPLDRGSASPSRARASLTSFAIVTQ